MTENDNASDGTERSSGGWPNNTRTAGKWHSWCGDCGRKNHKNASECKNCGYGSDGQLFLVKYQGNVGKPEYTSDGKSGVYNRSTDTATEQ